MKMKKKWLYAGIGAIILISIVAFVSMKKSAQPQDVLDINLAEHKDLALHIHPHLSIGILGQEHPIPAGIGISPNGMRVIHTHKPDGNLHVESPYPHLFYLQDFFTIWGKRFTGQCIFEYCADGNHTLKVYANGEESSLYGLVPLYDLDDIRIVYEETGGNRS